MLQGPRQDCEDQICGLKKDPNTGMVIGKNIEKDAFQKCVASNEDIIKSCCMTNCNVFCKLCKQGDERCLKRCKVETQECQNACEAMVYNGSKRENFTTKNNKWIAVGMIVFIFLQYQIK